jgi:hypothetical protein
MLTIESYIEVFIYPSFGGVLRAAAYFSAGYYPYEATFPPSFENSRQLPSVFLSFPG